MNSCYYSAAGELMRFLGKRPKAAAVGLLSQISRQGFGRRSIEIPQHSCPIICSRNLIQFSINELNSPYIKMEMA